MEYLQQGIEYICKDCEHYKRHHHCNEHLHWMKKPLLETANETRTPPWHGTARHAHTVRDSLCLQEFTNVKRSGEFVSSSHMTNISQKKSHQTTIRWEKKSLSCTVTVILWDVVCVCVFPPLQVYECPVHSRHRLLIDSIRCNGTCT